MSRPGITPIMVNFSLAMDRCTDNPLGPLLSASLKPIMPTPPAILALLNPGRTSHHYMAGVVAGAEQLGLRCGRVDLASAWQAQKQGPAAYASYAAELASWIKAQAFTHCIAYGHNAASLVSLESLTRPVGAEGVGPLTTQLGLRNFMLWTDHPEWCVQGTPMDEPMRTVLRHPLHTHLLKSRAAAAEASEVLQWPGVLGMPVGEDVRAMTAAAGCSEPTFDAVIVVSDAAAPTSESAAWLADEDPDPAAIDRAHLPLALGAARKAVNASQGGSDRWPALEPLIATLLEAKVQQPRRSFWTLSKGLGNPEPLVWAKSSPRRWYGLIGGLRRMVNWRRNFWPAWLARRVKLGVFGCDATSWGVEQSEAQRSWVDYGSLRQAFTSGRCVVSVNAGHDEEGVTHKPFQIAASGSVLVHHATSELEEYLESGRECLLFSRGPELLGHVRACGDDAFRRAMADAGLARCTRDHTWASRVASMLAYEG